MKLFCVERDVRGYLKVGEIYTFALSDTCTCGKKWIGVEEVISPFAHQKRYWRCTACRVRKGPDMVPLNHLFLARRFAPWNPDQLNISEQEVRELYAPKRPETTPTA